MADLASLLTSSQSPADSSAGRNAASSCPMSRPAGTEAETWHPEADLNSPYDGLRRERWSAMLGGLVTGLTAGFVVGLAPAPLGGLRTGLAYGLVVGIAAGLLRGALWIRYPASVSCAKTRERLPFSMENFMKWACDSGLLRIAGTAYQFRHRQLQERLTENSQS